MTDELLKLYIDCQPVIMAAMGEWQVGDRLTDNMEDIGVICGYSNDKKLLHVYFQRRAVIYSVYPRPELGTPPQLLLLPPAIDSTQPERSLWGMARELTGLYQKRKGGPWYCFGFGFETNGATPEEALLRAIKEQGK